MCYNFWNSKMQIHGCGFSLETGVKILKEMKSLIFNAWTCPTYKRWQKGLQSFSTTCACPWVSHKSLRISIPEILFLFTHRSVIYSIQSFTRVLFSSSGSTFISIREIPLLQNSLGFLTSHVLPTFCLQLSWPKSLSEWTHWEIL